MSSDRILYKTKPNMLLGCKKAIFGIIILIIILMISPVVIKLIGEMQVYLISQIKFSLTRYVAIAFFVVILVDVIYIIWQLIGWYSKEYILTDTKIVIKSGVLSTKKNYMPYATIQDINTSQSIVDKIFNVGSVSIFSAYDNNQMELKYISKPSEVEEIIFSRMVNRNFQAPPQSFPQQNNYEGNMSQNDDYLGRNEYYDEYEPITPITHERNPRGNPDFYPGDRGHKYEYEPYNNSQNGFSRNRSYNQVRDDYPYDDYNSSPNDFSRNRSYNQVRDDYPYDDYNSSPNDFSRNRSYNQVRDDYHYDDYNSNENNRPEAHYDETAQNNNQDELDELISSSDKAIQRHFDKFKR